MEFIDLAFSSVASNAEVIIGSFLALVFGGHVAYEGSRRNRKAEASTVFRSAFKDVVLNLTENPSVSSARIASLDCHSILSAAQQYRVWVYWLRRRAFDKAVDQYKKAYEEAKEGDSVFALFASEETDFAKKKRDLLHQAVFRLYAFGKET